MLKHKGYSFINVAGLTMGIAVCFLLFLWVKDELSYDQFHEKSDRIYRSLWEAKYGDNSWKIPLVPMPLAETMESEFPEVEVATQVYKGRFTTKKGTDFVRESNVLFVDEDFFEVFTVQTLEGATHSVIQNPDVVLITEKTAERYFGKTNNFSSIIGQNIERNDGKTMQIGGVIESFPAQSHFHFDFIASLNQLTQLERRKTSWGSATLWTYFVLDEQGDPTALHEKMQAYVDEHVADESFKEAGNFTSFPFESIKDIHLKPNLSYVWMFGIIAVFILVLAAINFINLATARAMMRAREVGVRKVLGSTRSQLVQQFFSESTLYVFVSVLLAIIVAEIALPYFNDFTNKSLSIDLMSSPFVWGLLITLVLVTALLTGAFPAFALSSFLPSKVIRGQLTKSKGKDGFRQALVVFQFCISGALIIGTLIVKGQLHFMQNKEMGFDKEQVLIIRSATALGNNYDPFIEKIKAQPAVQQVSTAQYLPGDGFDSTIFVPEQPSNYEQTSLSYCHIDEAFASTLKLELVAGRDFDPARTTDSTAYLLNETAAKRLGWEDPVGKKLSYGGRWEGQVIGIVKDFNFTSLHHDIEPLVLRGTAYRLSNIFVRLQPGNLKEQVQAIESEWKTMATASPFEFAFLDDEIQQLYNREKRMSSIFTVFSSIAIFIACLGLFGLAAFMAKQRTKEIGIRKVLGATTAGIVGMLSKDFLKPVLIALFLAVPLAWYFMNNWLSDFAYRIEISVGVFVFAGVVAVSIALLTVGFQSVKAALANPVESLKSE